MISLKEGRNRYENNIANTDSDILGNRSIEKTTRMEPSINARDIFEKEKAYQEYFKLQRILTSLEEKYKEVLQEERCQIGKVFCSGELFKEGFFQADIPKAIKTETLENPIIEREPYQIQFDFQ